MKYHWYKVEFYNKNTHTTHNRTVKVCVSRETDTLMNILKRKLKTLGFSNVDILDTELTATNYLR